MKIEIKSWSPQTFVVDVIDLDLTVVVMLHAEAEKELINRGVQVTKPPTNLVVVPTHELKELYKNVCTEMGMRCIPLDALKPASPMSPDLYQLEDVERYLVMGGNKILAIKMLRERIPALKKEGGLAIAKNSVDAYREQFLKDGGTIAVQPRTTY